jgi:CubicO group peptidase (beta-lactamase class C family)
MAVGDNTQSAFDQLCAFVETRMQQTGVPGVAVGILHGGQTYAAGLGVTSIDHPLPVTEQTLFQIGSISKTFTCLAAMRLIELGKLDLHTTVRTYLPHFRVVDETASEQATVWHLLTHMSGWAGDLFEDTGSGDDAMARYMALMAKQEQLAPIGTVWSYNNAGFGLTGHLIEQVTGQRYEKVMKELVFGPLCLERCLFDLGDVITHRFVVGHIGEGPEVRVLRPWLLPRARHPAGGILCDVRDLMRYASFQMGDGTVAGGDGGERAQVLRPETMALMHAPQASRWKARERIGLSWFIDDIDGVRQLWHSGSRLGQIASLVIIPEHRFAMVVLTNANAGRALIQDVRRWVLEHYLELETPEPQPIEASERELAAYVGYYTRPLADIELGMLCGRLVGQMVYKHGYPSLASSSPRRPPAPMVLAPSAEDRLLVMSGRRKGEQVEVIRRSEGTIGWLREHDRIYQRREKPFRDRR